jgi:hypothetical protein
MLVAKGAKSLRLRANMLMRGEVGNRDRGSLSLLTFGLFLILLVLAFETINISASFLVKRELLHVGESAIQRATHSLALDRYYQSNFILDSIASGVERLRVPIDCEQARSTFYSEIATSQLRDRPIAVESWRCEADRLDATIVLNYQPPLAIPIIVTIGNNAQKISATIGASAIMTSGIKQ